MYTIYPLLITLGKFLLGISLIVGIHELGHMLFAKMFGMRVEEYMIGFPPKIFKFKWGKTEYGLGAIPLGGFVKIAGMIDESMDETHLAKPSQPWEFRSKPKLQQLIVMLGGIIFNLASAFIIYTSLFYLSGEPYLSTEEVNKNGIKPTELGITIGLERGDKILKKNNQDYQSFRELQTNLSNKLNYTVLRKDKKIYISANKTVINAMKKKGKMLMEPLIPFIVQSVEPNSPVKKIGLQKGDKIIAINQNNTPYLQDLETAINTHAGKKVTIKYHRNGVLMHADTKINGRLGIQIEDTLEKSWKAYPFPKACKASLFKIVEIMTLQARGISAIITGKIEASKAIVGPVGIAKIFGMSKDAYSFWLILALISIIIAFMNLLPIPALDGGHAITILYEMVTRKKISNTQRMRVQKIGMFMIAMLMLYAILNDLYNLLG